MSVPKEHKIKYSWTKINGKKFSNKISVKELVDESDDSDSEDLVHLHRSFKCKLVDSQNELDVEMGSDSGGQAEGNGGEE